MSYLARTKGLEDAAALGRFIGTSKITTWYWLTARARPSLPMALHVYHRFGASLAAELSGKGPLPETNGVAQPEFHLPRRKEKKFRSWEAIEEFLVAALKRPAIEACSVTSLGRELDIDSRTLRDHFPKLCIKLAEKRRKKIHNDAAQRVDMLEKEIAAAATRLTQQGAYVDQRSVAATLGQPGLFCRPVARRVLRQLLASNAREYYPNRPEKRGKR